MSAERVGVARGEPFRILVDGFAVEAFPGETVAGAMLAAGLRVTRQTRRTGQPRGVFCGMGVCFDCVAWIDGAPHRRTCLTEARPDMVVVTQEEAGWSKTP
jgi:hypothetical protein